MKIVIGNKHKISIIEICCVIVSLISVFVCLIYGTGVYQYIVFLPLVFLVSYLSILLPNGKKSLTVKIISLCAFLRYVVLSVLQSICPVYSFAEYFTQDFSLVTKAIGLMCYELIFVSVFIKIYFLTSRKNWKGKRKFSNQVKERFTFEKNRYGIVFVFSVCTILYSLLNPALMSQISFLIIKSNTAIRMGTNAAESSSSDMILRQIFVTAILALFVIVVTWLRARIYDKHPKSAYRCSIVLAMLCTCMIISEQRSSQVYCAFAAVILLIQLYPEKKKNIITIIAATAGIVLVMLSIYKTFFAFMYSSYADAIANSDMGLESTVETLETYLLGPVSVASALQFGTTDLITFSLSQLFFDYGRSTIGVSFLMKGSHRTLTSVAYNRFVTSGRSDSGFLLPITGQGFEFFGFVFAPVLICLFFYLAFKIERVMFKSSSSYVVFFVAYVYIRVATCMVSSNLNSVLVALSTVLISAGTIFIVQRFLAFVKRMANG